MKRSSCSGCPGSGSVLKGEQLQLASGKLQQQFTQPTAGYRGGGRVRCLSTADTKINAWKVGQVSKSLKCECYAK